ncbi:MAG: hypothetical protein MUF04_07260, partial [Akkermansiaceae bacterium]|nr:hypothetical protein [Akkermansiaceae bacterium]
CSLEHFNGSGYPGGVSASVVAMLRRQLREKFPQACGDAVAMGTGGGAAGAAVGGQVAGAWGGQLEFPAGVLTEVTGVGAGWVVAVLLEEAENEPGVPELVLVDGADGFDPASFSARVCARLLWVRCRKSALEMVKAADWVVRDGNVPQVVVDATGLDRRELAQVPASAWWRLRQGAERSGCRLVVVAAARLVPAAGRRWRTTAAWGLDDLTANRRELLARLRVTTEATGQIAAGS